MATPEPVFVIEDLHASVGGQEILKGVDLRINDGEIHAMMGPNGSGKTTLANTLMGHPSYTVTRGRVLYRGKDITHLPPDERARRGIFLAFQYPTAIPGVTMVNFLRTALNAVSEQEVPVRDFRVRLKEAMELLKVDESFARRYVNDGFSGGEKKRAEVLQMAILRPHFAIMDETDSGLDIDALRTVAEGVNALMVAPDRAALVITHYQRLLDYILPQFVHVLYQGRIVRTGGPELMKELEKTGYDPLISELQVAEPA
ncbi:MAG: Fe-S cluster assembly ATPase SufC [Dehalococcoidia bacterium]|nr:Fe-S cluster assembly ATPase SufC [Dehalococcoidia bacterium]